MERIISSVHDTDATLYVVSFAFLFDKRAFAASSIPINREL